MGMSMASNLVKGGFTVNGFDLNEKTREKAKERGINPVSSLADAAKDVDFIVMSLPRTQDIDKCL
jgi:3-hydroxyisobutyrate dehydrogenase